MATTGTPPSALLLFNDTYGRCLSVPRSMGATREGRLPCVSNREGFCRLKRQRPLRWGKGMVSSQLVKVYGAERRWGKCMVSSPPGGSYGAEREWGKMWMMPSQAHSPVRRRCANASVAGAADFQGGDSGLKWAADLDGTQGRQDAVTVLEFREETAELGRSKPASTVDPSYAAWETALYDDEDSEFRWEQHWYPVALLEDLDPKVPTPFTLLGIDLVLWNDSQGVWRAHRDLCPHRLAPLSEGRIDNRTGDLQCSYHGWTFRGDGTCSGIPQASLTGPESRAATSPRACVALYPTVVSQGLLFVWPEEGQWERARRKEPVKLPPQFDDTEKYSSVSIQRDLFYGYDVLMENVCDPSHIEFAHHKVTGKRERAGPLPFKVSNISATGFSAISESNPRITSYFLPPCGVFSKLELKFDIPLIGSKTVELWICSFNIPMAPGKTRSIVCSARNFARISVPGKEWWAVYPRWLEHLTSNKVYDGDMIVLQGQEKALHPQGTNIIDNTTTINNIMNTTSNTSNSNESSNNSNESNNSGGSRDSNRGQLQASPSDGSKKGRKGEKSYASLTYTPTAADLVVLSFRNWLRRWGGGEPKWDPSGYTAGVPLPSTVLSKREMLDRLSQHTVKCSSCKGAYEGVKKWVALLWGASALLTAFSAVPPDPMVRTTIAAAAVAAFGVGSYLKFVLEPQFVFMDYIHSAID